MRWPPDEIERVSLLLYGRIGTPYAKGYPGKKDWVVRGKPEITEKSPSEFDCSGLARWIIGQGVPTDGKRIILPHGTIEQIKFCIPISREPFPLDLGFADLDESGEPDHVIVYYGMNSGVQTVVEARGKPYGRVIERPRDKWESQKGFLGWWTVPGLYVDREIKSAKEA